MKTLTMTRGQWNAVLDWAGGRRDELLIGPVGPHRDNEAERVLCQSIERVAWDQTSRWLRRWRELLIVAPLPEDDEGPPHRLIDRLRPADYNRLNILQVGRRARRGFLAGMCWSAAGWTQLDRLEVIGPGLPIWPLYPSTTFATNGIEERWSRVTGALSADVFHRVQSTSAAVVGCGRNGSLAAMELALLGIGGPLTLIDADCIEEANLDMVGVGPVDVGRPKVEAIADFLRRLRPDLKIIALPYPLPNPQTLDGLRRSDLIVTTTDRTMPRLAAALIASAYLRVHLDIGSGIFTTPSGLQRGADARLLLPGEACACCLGRMRHLDEAREELDVPFGEVRASPRPLWSEERAGSLISVNGAGVSCAVQLWLDLLSGRLDSSTWLRLEWAEDGRLTVSRLPGAGDTGCPVCRACGQGDFRFSAFLSSVTGIADEEI